MINESERSINETCPVLKPESNADIKDQKSKQRMQGFKRGQERATECEYENA